MKGNRKVCRVTLIISLISIFNYNLNAQQTLFHEIEFTASSIELKEWKIKDTSDVAFVLEKIDNFGRTQELRFYNYYHNLAYAGSGFYGGPIIKYEYKKNKIIETFFASETEMANDFANSEVPYRFIYYLNEQNEIIESEMKYKIDFNWTVESLDKTIKHLELYKQFVKDGAGLNEIFGYSYAFNKMNGIDPKRK